ncbi:sugar transferase [Candidatus Woesearchaeota archaeon]|nr:sugar transferase [Candidatus Woesearchaeota archaeon]
MKRIFDIVLSIILLIVLILPMLLIALLIRFTSDGQALYWSDRVGKNSVVFKMPKFRSMQTNTPVVATHLMKQPDEFLSPVGGFLRRSSLDELPQLFSILKGDMSFVGPRPALFNQDDLIALRIEKGVDQLMPGITGWAQVNGRDELSIADKVNFDVEYLINQSFLFDLRILWMTFVKVIKRVGVKH